MAMVVKLVALLFLLAFIAITTFTTTAHAGQNHLDSDRGHGRYGPGSVQQSQCSPQCNRRCGRTQYKKPCLFFCNKCCNKCLCVPPGYYGNKAVCPCYNNWKTKEGGPKCP